MHRSRYFGSVIALALFAGSVQPLPGQGQGAPPKCDTSEFRQFDFWVGDWDVTVSGHPAGTNLVTVEEDGCVVHEHWKGASGGTGQSFNYFDRGDGKWHQMWVSNSGTTLLLTGSLAGNVLTMVGERKQADGTTVLNRLSFRNNPDHTVRQFWETSADGGKSWSPAFDGLYRKRQE